MSDWNTIRDYSQNLISAFRTKIIWGLFLEQEINNKRYRVAQWGTGHTGARALKGIIKHPDYDLVGVKVYSDAKVGRDAGELCGVAPTGIIATQNIEDIIAAKPDCVMYMPMTGGHDVDDMCRLLESGANIVTTVTDYHDPDSIDQDIRRQIEAACVRGGTSLYATGASPGWITEIFPLTVIAFQRRLDYFLIEEFADMTTRASPELIDMMFGMDPSEMDLSSVTPSLEYQFMQSLQQITRALRLPIDKVTTKGTVAVTAKTVQIGVATIKAGTVGAWIFDVTGLRNGKPLMTFRPHWYITQDLKSADVHFRDYPSGWHVVVEGDVPLDIDIRFDKKDYANTSPGINANIPVNVIPNVCAARPGILTTVDLPPIIAHFG